MSAVLTAASELVCPHGFSFKVKAKQKLFTVDGDAVVVDADLLGVLIETCTNNQKCTSIASITGGLSTRLRIGDKPVALATAKGLTNVGLVWQVKSAGQAKLEAV